MSLSERIHQLNSEIGASVERALAELRQEISQRLRASNEEIQRRLDEFTPSLPSSYLSHDDLAPAAERELGTERPAERPARPARRPRRHRPRPLAGRHPGSAAARVGAATPRARPCCWSAAASLRGWGSEGFGDAEAALRGLVLDAADGAWGRLGPVAGRRCASAPPTAPPLCSRVESPLPHEGVLVPIVLRDRVAAGLYADRLDDARARGRGAPDPRPRRGPGDRDAPLPRALLHPHAGPRRGRGQSAGAAAAPPPSQAAAAEAPAPAPLERRLPSPSRSREPEPPGPHPPLRSREALETAQDRRATGRAAVPSRRQRDLRRRLGRSAVSDRPRHRGDAAPRLPHAVRSPPAAHRAPQPPGADGGGGPPLSAVRSRSPRAGAGSGSEPGRDACCSSAPA